VFFGLGPGALGGDEAPTAFERFLLDFFFSIHTFATIGYGTVHPVQNSAHWVVTLESLVGLLAVALMTGLVFARFSRPIARIIFSERAVIAPYAPTGRGFMFRLVNGRTNQLMDLQATVALSWRLNDGRPGRSFHELPLERPGVILFPLSWTVVHPIGPDSPLYGVSGDELRARDAEFTIVIRGMDETFAQQVHARTSYRADEVLAGAKFSDIFLRRPGAPLGIDISRIHRTEPAPLPDQPALAREAVPAAFTEPAGAPAVLAVVSAPVG
jgi:inward rectifier potassium channel